MRVEARAVVTMVEVQCALAGGRRGAAGVARFTYYSRRWRAEWRRQRRWQQILCAFIIVLNLSLFNNLLLASPATCQRGST